MARRNAGDMGDVGRAGETPNEWQGKEAGKTLRQQGWERKAKEVEGNKLTEVKFPDWTLVFWPVTDFINSSIRGYSQNIW